MLKTNKQWIFIILLVIIAIIVFIKWREYYYKKLLHTDTLTQIPNKQYFMKTAEKYWITTAINHTYSHRLTQGTSNL